MAADSTDFPKYGSIEAPAAFQARKALPPELQLGVQDILYEICTDPKRFPERMEAFSRDGSIQTYSHPDPPLDITIEIVEDESKIYVLQYAPRLDVKKTVFISYSHNDREWLDRVRKSLRMLERKGLVEIWDDSAIKPGDKWREEIDKALQRSKVAILLVSPNFAASDFILEEELPYIQQSAQSQSVVLSWIAVSSAPYDDIGVGEIQAMNDPTAPLDSLDEGSCNRALTKIYEEIKATVTGQ